MASISAEIKSHNLDAMIVVIVHLIVAGHTCTPDKMYHTYQYFAFRGDVLDEIPTVFGMNSAERRAPDADACGDIRQPK